MKRQLLLFFVVFLLSNNAFAQQAYLNLKSHAVMVFDTQGNHIIYDKNAEDVMPIASITKLMTAIVTLDAQLPLHEVITIDTDDIDRLKNTRSRLNIGAELSRQELLKISLMSSENRAASALGRTYPGGLSAFVNAMNKKAYHLGMYSTYFVEPTGLSSGNVSTASDLAKLVEASNQYDLIQEYSTTSNHVVNANKRNNLQFVNSNSLVRNKNWNIDISKTGYINEAGRCLVMKATIQGRSTVIVLLNSWGKNTRIGDANRVKRWMEARNVALK